MSDGGIRTGGSRGMCPLRGEPTRGLAPSVGARAVSASATSNAHPLRHLKPVLSVEFAREWGRKVGFTACDSLF